MRSPLDVSRMSSHEQSGRGQRRSKNAFVYQIYKYTPPDCHELIAEVKSSSVAEWKVYQLDSLLSAEDRRNGLFHYRWLRL